MNTLEKQIKTAQEAYYNDKPIMSDIEFDALWDQLKEKYPESKLLKEVGIDHTDGFVKVKHKIIMGSQNKANTAKEMNTWFNKCRDHKSKYVLASEKLDGCSIELEYENGEYQNGITRGDGYTGDLISLNVHKMKNYPHTLKEPFTGVIRGEVLLFKSDKEKCAPDKKNCRNAASGIMKRLDGIGCEYLQIVAYDVREEGKQKFKTQTELLEWLKYQGFQVPDYKVFPLKDMTGEMAIQYLSSTWSKKRDYDIDGLVWKTEDIDYNDIETSYRPTYNIALKPKYTLAETTIIDIEWSISNGTLTPVAIVKPVDLDGATVQRASLANISLMEDLGIEIGHKVLITRAGMIIPKILKDIDTGKSAEGYVFE